MPTIKKSRHRRSHRHRHRHSHKSRSRRQRGGTISSLFKNSYIVTTDTKGKRYIDLSKSAAAAGLKTEVWNATVIDPNMKHKLPEQGIGTSHYTDRKQGTYNLGVIGCYLSHRSLFRKVADSQDIGTLVLEDDAIVPTDFFSRLAAIEKEVPSDWDIIFLSKTAIDGDKVSDHILKLKKDITGTKNFGTWAFIVKNSSLKTKILPVLENMLDNIDMHLNRYADTINMYLTQPEIISLSSENSSKSIITSMDGNKTWAVVQYDNRPVPEQYKPLIEINKEYCKKHGYEYIFKTDEYDLPPYWVKVKLCLDLLNSDKYKGILWLDTDASVYNCKKSLDDFTSDFTISKDPWGNNEALNAGVWIVKNTSSAKTLMADWFNQYKKEKWVKTNGSWSIDTQLHESEREWAGINYEQGSFSKIILPKYTSQISVNPSSLLSHWNPIRGSFIGHFYKILPGFEKKDTKYYLNKFTKERIMCDV
jgi:GR25 family glycosyltransferase involved in LPS biosynthesis